MKKIKVCAAVIRKNGKTLVCSRPKATRLGDKMEFPGGKVEAGEDFAECIIRELREELDAVVFPMDILANIDYEYPEGVLNIVFIRCMLSDSRPLVPRDGQDFFWADTGSLDEIPFLPADLPIAKWMADACKK